MNLPVVRSSLAPRTPSTPPLRSASLLALAAAVTLSGCSSLENMLSGDKLDYRSAAQAKPQGLEVPPDLTQLARDGRYQVPGGVVSAAAAGAAAPARAATGAAVAPRELGAMRIERDGTTRWLVVGQPPEDLWPRLRSFWQDLGFTLTTDAADVGIMETDWAENRAKLPQDFIRRTIGRVFDSAFSTSERDRFRMRVERGSQGTEIFITHRGMREVYVGERKENTAWEPRPSDPELEAELVARLMVRLGAPEGTARPAVQAALAATPAPAAAPRARRVQGAAAASLEMDDGFDRAWRRLGLVLDRSGFSVEDRDRSAGVYFVRYVDAKEAEKAEPGFFTRLFGSSTPPAPNRYRVFVKAIGDKTAVSILNANGSPDNSEVAGRIVERLVNELK